MLITTEADSFKISANMPYIYMLKTIWNVLMKLHKTFCGSIAKNCSKALIEKKSATKKLKYFRKL